MTIAEQTDEPGRRRRTWSGWLVVVGVVLACYLTGLVVVNLETTGAGAAVDRLFPRIGQGNTLDRRSIDAAYVDVEQDYYLRSVDSTIATQGAERGLVDALKAKYNDRFSAFFTADQAKSFHSGLAGVRSGSIGIALEERCAGAVSCAPATSPTEIVIEDVLRNQPADRAGVLPGDQLISVNGRQLTRLAPSVDAQFNAVGALIRGTPGTTVVLGLERAGVPTQVTVTREDLHIPSVYTQRFGSTLYVQVTGFDSTTGNDFKSAVQQGLGSGAASIVLDLRANGGGYVDAAQTVASQFVKPVPGQRQDVVVRRGRLDASGAPSSAQRVEHDSIQAGGVALTVPVAVLIDGDTASAAEIVSACLKDYHRATLVGQKTFGKGSVQTDFDLPDGNVLHLTIEKWYGPAGESIDVSGITPDDNVALGSPDHRFRLDSQGPDASLDPQLQRALSLVGTR